MGSCLSKKKGSDSSAPGGGLVAPQDGKDSVTETVEKEKTVETGAVAVEESVKKEIFVIKHRKSHDIDKRVEQKGEGDGVGGLSAASSGSEAAEMGNGGGGQNGVVMSAAPVRTSSCTKEEVDAILIQCGRLSRSSSGKAGPGVCTPSKKYSGSKRSYDFDENDCDFVEKGNGVGGNIDCCADDDERAERRHHRHRHRQSRASPQGRRRTPSRERDPNRQQQRSGSRDRASSGSGGGGGGGRRVSRSPGRRSDNPPTTSAEGAAARPGKMISIPATVMDKGNNGNGGGGVESGNNGTVRRVLVKRNGVEVTASGSKTPRSQSPANARVGNSNDNQSNPHPSLSRNPSRKAEQSPYRRNPLSEIDTNSNNRGLARDVEADCQQKPSVKEMNCGKVVHGTNSRSSSRGSSSRGKIAEEGVEPKGLQPKTSNIETTIVVSGAESLKPQGLTRTRSSRRSRDLDLNPESLLNPAPSSYTSLLLEDIQNFHQKNTNTQTATPSFSLPACVSKAQSILEAVADLNSCTSSNPSYAFSDDRRNFAETYQNSMDEKNSGGKKRLEGKDPFVLESEIGMGNNDIMEPSLHKYITVKRGGTEEMEEQESSGSNSFVGGSQLHSWEPNSGDSTDCWTSRSNTKEEHPRAVCYALSEPARASEETQKTQKRVVSRRRETDQQHHGIGGGRLGSSSRAVPSIAST